MNKKIFEQFLGKPVEIFLAPDTPRTSGILLSCDDDHFVIGEEFWSYSAVLGIRSLKKNNRPARPKQELKLEETASPIPEPNLETPKPIEKPAAEVKKEIKNEVFDTKPTTSPEILIEDLVGREFEGTIVSFFPERGWGFIDSPEVKALGVPLQDGEKVFVHMNQVTDEALRYKLSTLTDKNANPNIKVVFKFSSNQRGLAADDVREKGKTAPKLPDDVLKVDMSSAIYEEGEIEYFRRYEEIPHGEIRVKGNKLYRFDEEDVIDPVLAVFLECSPSAEGQKVKFIKTMGKRGNMKATNVSAAVPFPEEKIKDWERSGLIQKAKERMGVKD